MYVKIFLQVPRRDEQRLYSQVSMPLDPKESGKSRDLSLAFSVVPATCCGFSTYDLLDNCSRITLLVMRYVKRC